MTSCRKMQVAANIIRSLSKTTSNRVSSRCSRCDMTWNTHLRRSTILLQWRGVSSDAKQQFVLRFLRYSRFTTLHLVSPRLGAGCLFSLDFSYPQEHLSRELFTVHFVSGGIFFDCHSLMRVWHRNGSSDGAQIMVNC